MHLALPEPAPPAIGAMSCASTADRLVYGSVCSGIEAATVAWEPLGWQPAFFAEIEPFPTGTVRFDDGAVTVVADLPKKVEWVQALLAATVERIRASGDDPGEYIETAFKVPERKYGAWPAHIRAAFEPARTVKTGKPTFTLKPNTP